MTERDFLLALDDDPDDIDTYRVYADWLEDQGATARAQLIRIEIDLALSSVRRAQSEALYERERILQVEVEKTWAEFRKWKKLFGLAWRHGIPHLARSESLPTVRRLRTLPEFPCLMRLSTTTIPKPESLAVFAERTSLHTLALTGRLEDVAALAELTGLKGLSFYHVSINDDILGQLRGLGELRILDLTNSPITDAGMAHLAAFPLLERLCLESSGITDAGLAHLRPLCHLKELNLTNTGITDAGLETVGDLRHLTTLRLSDTQITDAGVQRLASLTNLRDLDLARTGATAAAFDTLVGLKKLRRLSLDRIEGIDDTSVLRLVALPELRDLDLRRTDVTRSNLNRLAALLPSLRRVRIEARLGIAEEYGAEREVSAFLAHMEEVNLLIEVDHE